MVMMKIGKMTTRDRRNKMLAEELKWKRQTFVEPRMQLEFGTVRGTGGIRMLVELKVERLAGARKIRMRGPSKR